MNSDEGLLKIHNLIYSMKWFKNRFRKNNTYNGLFKNKVGLKRILQMQSK